MTCSPYLIFNKYQVYLFIYHLQNNLLLASSTTFLMGFHIHNYATQFSYQFSDGLHWLDLESVSQQSLVYELHWDVNQVTMVKEKWYKNPPSIFNDLNHFGMFNDLGFFLANIAYNRGYIM